MSVTCGFYNSLKGDRKYDSVQMSSIFDGLIIDGVYASIGTAFVTKATTGLVVNVGIGKAWFNHTWTLNDSILPITLPISDILLNRIDAIVIEVNATDSVRDNVIKVVQGQTATNPVRPTMTQTESVHQYPICYIYRAAEGTEIRQADITNMVGTPSTPFVTGIIQTLNLDELLGQWEDELDKFVADETAAFKAWRDAEKTSFKTWQDNEQNKFYDWKDVETAAFKAWQDNEKAIYYAWFAALKADMLAEQAFLNQWVADQKISFTAWFDQMKLELQAEQQYLADWIATEQTSFTTWFEAVRGQLTTDVAGNLQEQVNVRNTRTYRFKNIVLQQTKWALDHTTEPMQDSTGDIIRDNLNRPIDGKSMAQRIQKYPYIVTVDVPGMTAEWECKVCTIDHTSLRSVAFLYPYVMTEAGMMTFWSAIIPDFDITIEHMTFEEVFPVV